MMMGVVGAIERARDTKSYCEEYAADSLATCAV